MRVVVAGGGTAGHIEPALAFADALRRRDPSSVVTALGTERGLETRLVPARGYELDADPAGPDAAPPGTPTCCAVPGPAAGRGQRGGRRAAHQAGPTSSSGFGGFVAGPAYLAARRLRRADRRARGEPPARLGQPAGRAAHAVRRDDLPGHADPRTRRHLGLPIRRSIATLDRPAVRDEARRTFGLLADRPALLVTGGSQGAQRLNDAASGAVQGLRDAGIQVLHATGTAQRGRGARPAGARRTSCCPTSTGWTSRYAAADLALCRAGANTVSRADRGRAAGGVRAAAHRQRRAGADRARRWSPPAAG